MPGQDEVDEFGIPIKKKAPEKKQEVDEFGIPIKKKDDTGSPSATGTPTTSPSPSPSLSPAEARRQRLLGAVNKEADRIATEVSTPIGGKLPPQPIALGQPELDVPLEEDVIKLQEPEKTGPKTAIDVAKEKYPGEIPLEEQMLSEELETVGGEIQQIGTEMQLGTTFEELPEGPPIVKPPKFKENRDNPDGTQRINDEYYGATRQDGELVFNDTEKTPATTNERLAAQGFYYNPQNKKTGGEFGGMFEGSPDMLFQKYEPLIVDYLRNLESTSPSDYKSLQSKIENGNFTQKDQFNIISEIEAKKFVRTRQDIEIAQARLNQMVQEGEELPPEAQELVSYIEEKLPQLEEAEGQLQTLYQNYPEEVKEQWTQKVLQDRWEKSSGLGALTPAMDIVARKTVNIVPNFVNSTGQFLYRAVGANETADSWNNFWEQATYTTPSTPIVTTNPETGETEIDWANAMLEVGPQLAQMYLVFGKAGAALQVGAEAAVGANISKNTGLFMSGFFLSYKDVYSQAKDANLSDADAHNYATFVAMGIAAAELIMPDRNFFASGKDDILRFTIQEAARGTKGKALMQATTTFVKNNFKEQVEEFTQDLITNASAVVADGTMDGANFDAELFSKEGILTTAIITGLTAGVASSGRLVGDLKQRSQDLYALSQNYENFTQQLETLVQDQQVTPEQAERLVQEVDALRVAETRVPQTMPVEQRATVVPLISEKDELLEEKKNLDPIFHAPIDERIEAIDNEILATTQPQEVAQEGEAKPKMDISEFSNENESYRVIVGEEAFNDLVESGVVRTNAKTKGNKGTGIDLSNRPTAFPSFSKGRASIEYASENPDNYIIVTSDESIKPSTKGRHGKGTTMFPTDENGNPLEELSGEKVKVYKHVGEGQYELVYANGQVVKPQTKEAVAETPVAKEEVPEKELTPEQNKQNHLVAEIKGYNELTPAKRRTKEGTQKAIRIGQLAQELGFDLQTDKQSGRFRATNKSGKKVISVSVKEDVAEPRQEDITFTKQQIDEGAFNWSGEAYDPKIDLGLPWADVKKGIADIQKGVMSVPAKRVANAMRKVQEDGGYTVKANIAGERMEVFIPLNEVVKEYTAQQDDADAAMYDAWFESLSPEQKEAEFYYIEYGEDTETEPDQATEGETLETDTEGSTTKTGQKVDISPAGSGVGDVELSAMAEAKKRQVEKQAKQAQSKVTPEQESKAKEYGYASPFQAVASINKNLGKDYTVADFDTIPDSEFKKASEQSETVKKNKATEAKLADIQSRRQSIKDRLAEKVKESRGKLGSGIDPSILKDLIELGATYIEEGVVKAKDFVARMRADMKELGIDDSKITDKEIKSKIFDKVKSPLPPEQVGAIEQKNDDYPEGKDETFPPTEKTKTGGSQKIKSVIDAYANRSNMPDDLRQGLIDQVGLYYTQLSNEQTFALGKEIIDALGMEAAINEALTSPDLAPVLRVMILGSGINEYKAQQKKTKVKEEIDELSDKQNNLKDKLDLMARDYGRAIQLLYPIYQVSGIAAKRKIQKEIDKRNAGKEPKVKQAVKEIEEVINDEKITKDDLENASEFDKNSLEAKLKEAERRIRELEKDPTKATTKKTYTRTVSKEQSDKALKQLLGKAYAFPALDPEVFKNIKIVGTYAMESLIIKGQASYQNFHDLLARKLRGKYKSAYADLYKEIAKDLDGVDGLEIAENVDDVQSQIDYFERVAKLVKNPDNAVVNILKKAGYTKTNKNGKESIDWTKVITDRTSVAAAIASLKKELSNLNLSRGQLATLEKIAEEKIRAAVEARKAREIQKIIERNENNALVRTLKKANRKSKVDKLVELARMGALNNKQIRDIVADELGIVTLTDEAVARIDELQELLEKAPKGFVSSKIEEEIAFITAQYKLDFVWEVYRERFFMRMLSGFATFIKNATGVGVALTRTLQVAARTKGNKRVANVLGNQFKEASTVFAQVFRNGGVDKGIAFLDYTGQKAGIPRIRYAEYHKFRPLGVKIPINIKGVNINPFTFLLDNEKYIGRVLGATDAFVQTLSSGLKQYEYEYLMQAKANPKLTSAQVAQLAYDNLYSIELSDAKDIAEKELSESGVKYNQRDINRRAYEVIERARNPKTVERGEIVAQQDAFKAPDGIGIFPFVAQGLSGVKRSVEYMVELEGIKDTPIATALTSMSRLLGDSIIPFVGGVSNVMEKALELNPVYGIPKAVINRLVGANLNKSDAEKADFYKDKSVDLALRSAIGLFYFGMFMAMMEASRMLAPDDEDESYTGIFGKGSEQFTEDEIIKLLRKKNTIRMFGMTFSLDYFGTMGIALKNYALLKDLERYDPKFKKEGVWDNIMAALAIVVTEQFKSSFFESMGRFSGFVTSPTKDANQKYIASQFSNILATHVIPFTNLIRQTGQALNPQAKMALDLPDLLLKYSGLTAGYGLKPAFDYRGREYDTGDIYASSADGLFKMFTQKFSEGDDIDKFLLGNGIAVTSPSRVSSNPENNKLMIYNEDGTSRPLTQEEFYEYKKLKADHLNELLTQDISILRDEAKYLQAEYTKEEAERKLQSFFSSEFNSPSIDYALEMINEKYGDVEMYLNTQ